jgi:hypothetical protein
MPYVNHYSFHILDPDWGHLTIKISGHPPFPAQVILNGHDYVACQARKAGVAFTKEGNCFTAISDAAGLAKIAETSPRLMNRIPMGGSGCWGTRAVVQFLSAAGVRTGEQLNDSPDALAFRRHPPSPRQGGSFRRVRSCGCRYRKPSTVTLGGN